MRFRVIAFLPEAAIRPERTEISDASISFTMYQHVMPESLSPIYSDGENDSAAALIAYVCPLDIELDWKSVDMSVSAAFILSSVIPQERKSFLRRSSPSFSRPGSDFRRAVRNTFSFPSESDPDSR